MLPLLLWWPAALPKHEPSARLSRGPADGGRSKADDRFEQRPGRRRCNEYKRREKFLTRGTGPRPVCRDHQLVQPGINRYRPLDPWLLGRSIDQSRVWADLHVTLGYKDEIYITKAGRSSLSVFVSLRLRADVNEGAGVEIPLD